MNDLEDEMRRALFGNSAPAEMVKHSASVPAPSPKRPKLRSPKIQVTMKVSKEFEGETELFIYEADTLSTLTAEIDAKAAAKKKKFKYFDVLLVKPIH